MIWAYFGLMMAGLAQLGTRLAGTLFTHPGQVYLTIGLITGIAGIGIAKLNKSVVPRLVARYGMRS